jgi:hypothetical protein
LFSGDVLIGLAVGTIRRIDGFTSVEISDA